MKEVCKKCSGWNDNFNSCVLGSRFDKYGNCFNFAPKEISGNKNKIKGLDSIKDIGIRDVVDAMPLQLQCKHKPLDLSNLDDYPQGGDE